jgi:hypothetical protein
MYNSNEMKNLMIYINPKKHFENELKISVKIQIDNCFRLGWKNEDILLVTNFPYEYGGIKALVVEDDAYCTYFPRCSKWGAIIKLFKKQLIKDNSLYWYHDFDAYQMVDMNESEIPESDMALSDYGPGYSRFSCGSMFFRKSAEDIFVRTKELMDSYKTRKDGVEYDEVAFGKVLRHRRDIRPRVKKINISYNFHSRKILTNYPAAIKPIRVVHCHFHHAPFFLHGHNKLGVQLAPDKLVKIFNNHGVS